MNAQELNQIRKLMKMTQVQLAVHLGISERMIRYYEKGKKDIPLVIEKYLLLKNKATSK